MNNKIHISQLLDGDLLVTDGVQGVLNIKTRLQENGNRLAISAQESFIGGDEQIVDRQVSVTDAMDLLAGSCGYQPVKTLNGMYAVLESDRETLSLLTYKIGGDTFAIQL